MLREKADKDANRQADRDDEKSNKPRDALIQSFNKLVAAVVRENVVLVEAKHTMLFAEKNPLQDSKKLVEQLKGDG